MFCGNGLADSGIDQAGRKFGELCFPLPQPLFRVADHIDVVFKDDLLRWMIEFLGGQRYASDQDRRRILIGRRFLVRRR